jgi:hypothetical protein
VEFEMVSDTNASNTFSLRAYRGDAKTLLAFNFGNKKNTKNLAGFSIACQPKGQLPYFIHNDLRFKTATDHAQDPKESAFSSINSPIHKFRWVHYLGSVHQGLTPFFGEYTYTATPRFFDGNGSMLPIDPAQSASVVITVDKFKKGGLQLGFTRGFVQSQAFVSHFGLKARIRPKGKDLIFDTSQASGQDAHGNEFTFLDQYAWLGSTARERVFAILQDVVVDKTIHLDLFAYDLTEPDLIKILLQLAAEGRIRVILDNAGLHHGSPPKPEDQFEKLFRSAATGASEIKRGRFGNFAHDKVMILSKGQNAMKVLTGSTNFSVNGFYVNSNHVLVFDDAAIATAYAGVFEESWQDGVAKTAFSKSKWATAPFPFATPTIPRTEITFAPHQTPFATEILKSVADRITAEANKASKASVLFAVMQLNVGSGPVLPALMALHKSQDIFTYGISDSPGGISVYPVGKKTGVLVTGKPGKTRMPPPFNQVPSIAEHQIHHKFVVCGFNGDDPVVYCGSSNLALGGEEKNGDNLLAIHDGDVATVFAIEALALVDHFDFLDKARSPSKKSKPKVPPASKQQAAEAAEWFLSTTDKWAAKYFDPNDLHFLDRELFG